METRQRAKVFQFFSAVGLLEQLDGCVSFIVVFKFSPICRSVSYSSQVTNEFSSAWFVHFVTSLYLCFSESRVTVWLGAVILAKILVD